MTETHASAIERFFRSGLKLPHLRILVALSELGQVTRVAKAFHVTQPAISKQIAEIEDALGLPVLQRKGKAVELTEVGKVLASRGKVILRQLDLAHKDVGALIAGTAGHARLGAVTTITDPLILNGIELFNSRAPFASVTFVEATLDRLLTMLADGEIDVVLGRNRSGVSPIPLHEHTLLQESFVFVAGTAHPLGDPARVVHWEDLRGAAWVVPLRSSPAFATLRDTLAAHGIALSRVTVESSSVALNIALMESGRFVSILPLALAQRHVNAGSLRILSLTPLQPLQHVVMYWPIDLSNPTAELLIDCLREAAADLSFHRNGERDSRSS
jgi:DNA-binding transcriptional LysR family regulator